MFTSESDAYSWDYIPPKKLQTTLLGDSGFSDSVWRAEEYYLVNGKTIVTPKDCTRSNSPIKLSSPLFESSDENEVIRTMYEQLLLIRDRHATLKTYISSVRAQLQQSFNLAIAELQGKRNILISKVDLLYDKSFTVLCAAHKEKERKIESKDLELEKSLEEIERVIQKIEDCGKESEEIEAEVMKSLRIWVDENDITADLCALKPVEFNYRVVRVRKEAEKENDKVRKNSSRCCGSGKHRIHKEDGHRHESSKGSFKEIMKQNNDFVHRLAKLEQEVTRKFKLTAPNKLLESTFDLNASESPISISTLYSDSSEISDLENRLRVYIPQGYPSYTCFYLIRVAVSVTVGQIVDKLKAHMGLKENFGLRADPAHKFIESSKKAAGFYNSKLYLVKI